MKKFVVSLVSVVTLLVPTQVLAQNWVQVSGRILVDADSIRASRRDRNILIFKEKYFPLDLPGYFVGLRVVNCAIGHTKLLEEVLHNDAGRVVGRRSIKGRGGYVSPGSDVSRVLNFVCK